MMAKIYYNNIIDLKNSTNFTKFYLPILPILLIVMEKAFPTKLLCGRCDDINALSEKTFQTIERKITRILRFSINIQRGKDNVSVRTLELLRIIKKDSKETIFLNEEQLKQIVEKKNVLRSNKFSINNGWIRVNYGHGVKITTELLGDAVQPPNELFYLKHEGEVITKEEGIKPYASKKWPQSANCVYLVTIKLVTQDFKRKKVPLSDREEWKKYIQIDAKSMYENGVKFISHGDLYMVKFVDGSFIKFL